MLKTHDFYYDLPEELIAQTPLERRDASRLMTLDRKTGEVTHRHFYDLLELLQPGDCLVMNNSRVLPARLLGHRVPTGGAVEVLLLKDQGSGVWECLTKPGRKTHTGTELSFGDGDLTATVVGERDDGNKLVQFHYEGIFLEVLERLGKMPLPPYIKEELQDGERYQTVYSKINGSAAAPTAGLHFTQELLDKLAAKGVKEAYITLPGHRLWLRFTTGEAKVFDFTPLLKDAGFALAGRLGILVFCGVFHALVKRHGNIGAEVRLDAHTLLRSHEDPVAVKMGRERHALLLDLSESGQGKDLKSAGIRQDRAVPRHEFVQAAHVAHNLVTRTLESLADENGYFHEASAWTDIFIYPGYKFKALDALITNFHLPESTLVMLVSAFADREKILNAYNIAVQERYRFFSFGDAMLIS